MILVGNQRGGGRDLALHLLKEENDHVEIHEVRGFVSSDLRAAFNEAYAISRGSRCKQYLFSLSLNPPAFANVATADFEAAIARIESELGLEHQPRAIVFHEKGRRHAHCVWSRLRSDDMKAVQLSFTHKKLMNISRDLYIEHGWKMPHGLAQSKAADPRNFTLEEWQQAKRNAKDPRAIKVALQDAWAISDTKNAFMLALKERGYRLARGDSRGFVAVDVHGEVYSLTRWLSVKKKDIGARLGSETDLSDVATAKTEIAEDMRPALSRIKGELLGELSSRNQDLRDQAKQIIARQREARQSLKSKIEERQWTEARERQARFQSGLKGLWDWARGENRRIRERNETEANAAASRDRAELDAMIFAQLEERRRMIDLRAEIAREFATRSRTVRDDAKAFLNLAQQPQTADPSRRKRTLDR